jgi:hypothetical protein
VEQLHREADVRSIEGAEHDLGLAQAKALCDLLAHRRRSGRGECEHHRAPELLVGGAQSHVTVGPSMSSPAIW